jgi:hypothetical protein
VSYHLQVSVASGDVHCECPSSGMMWCCVCLFTQHMFAYLQESSLSYYDTSGFCSVFKDPDGGPVRVGVQQDASEFFASFTQQVEAELAGNSNADLLKACFSVGLCNILDGGEGRRSETKDTSMFLRLVGCASAADGSGPFDCCLSMLAA